VAINLLETVQALQQTLSLAAKQSLDRRFGALYDKVYRLDVLWQAWRLVRNKGGGPGLDGETIEYIENELGEMTFLHELRDELKNETYRPQPVKRVWIEKPGQKGAERPLELVKDLFPRIPFSDRRRPLFLKELKRRTSNAGSDVS